MAPPYLPLARKYSSSLLCILYHVITQQGHGTNACKSSWVYYWFQEKSITSLGLVDDSILSSTDLLWNHNLSLWLLSFHNILHLFAVTYLSILETNKVLLWKQVNSLSVALEESLKSSHQTWAFTFSCIILVCSCNDFGIYQAGRALQKRQAV